MSEETSDNIKKKNWMLIVALILSITSFAIVTVGAWIATAQRNEDLCDIARDNRALNVAVLDVFTTPATRKRDPQIKRAYSILRKEPISCGSK